MREVAAAIVVLAITKTTTAQSTTNATPATPSVEKGQVRLEDQLVVGLRATRADQRIFLRKVAEFVEKGNFDHARVLAIFEWARQRNDRFPFPYFERAMRFDSKRANVTLPSVQLIATPLQKAG
jgi:hypothetical protein